MRGKIMFRMNWRHLNRRLRSWPMPCATSTHEPRRKFGRLAQKRVWNIWKASVLTWPRELLMTLRTWPQLLLVGARHETLGSLAAPFFGISMLQLTLLRPVMAAVAITNCPKGRTTRTNWHLPSDAIKWPKRCSFRNTGSREDRGEQ